jgi:hypothetical protein
MAADPMAAAITMGGTVFTMATTEDIMAATTAGVGVDIMVVVRADIMAAAADRVDSMAVVALITETQ